MATGPASAILAALKTKAAAAIAGALVVGGGATAVAVTTGAVHLPGHTTTTTTQSDQHTNDAKDGSDARAHACATNGDAQKLADAYKAMFGGSAKDAQGAICQVFVNASGGQAVGLGDIRQALDLAAWIESKGGATACLTAATHGDGSGTNGSGSGGNAGNSGDHGKSGDHGSGNGNGGSGSGSGGADAHGQPTLTIPPASTATTEAVLKAIFTAEQSGRPLAQMARACGAPHGVRDAGTDGGTQASGSHSGNGGAKPGPTPEPAQ